MLTNAAAKAAGAQTHAYKLHDQGGMHLLVRPTGSKSWQQKYRWRGREKLLTLGQFPEVNVARARILQAQAKALLEEGVDPSRAQATADSFEQLARAWHRHHRSAWSAAHANDVLESLERDVFPDLGKRPIGSVQPRELLAIVRKVEERGCLETAGRLRQRLSAIFGFGIAEGLCEDDPAARLGRAMKKGKLTVPHPALTSIEDCRELLRACEADTAAATTIMASRFLALTAVRLSAVRGMRWGEVDLDECTWTVPAERMKLSRAKKGEARFDHVVPLSAQALFVLRGMLGVDEKNGHDTRSRPVDDAPGCDNLPHPGKNMHQDAPNMHRRNAGSRALVFPGRSGAPIGEGTLRELYQRAGFAGRHVPHGWRSSFSTILNEDMGPDWRDDIDRALAHVGKDKVEAAYNRALMLDRRREVLDRWGELLSG